MLSSKSMPVDDRSSNWIVNLIVVAAMVGIAIFLVRSMDDEADVQLPQDGMTEVVDTDLDTITPVEAVATQEDTNVEPTVVSQDNVDESPPGKLFRVITVVNQLFEGNVENADALIGEMHEQLGGDRSDLQRAFDALNEPTGIASIKEGVVKEKRWLLGENQAAFTYRLVFPQILDDLQRYCDAYLGDRVFNEVLAGIRDDVDGPQVDLRKEFFPRIDNEVILVVDRHAGSSDERLTVIFALKEVESVRKVVRRFHQIEPNNSTEHYRGTEILVVEVTQGKTTAWCVVNKSLVIGDLSKVKSMIDRTSTP
ncbi:MAG: hypothetical protein AAGG48_17820 [Planctomycetota bacterium]